MKLLANKAILAVAISMVGSAAFATPNVAPPCEADQQVKNPLSSPATPIFFNDSCSKVYVAPPESGTVKLTSFLKHVNLGSCDALVGAQASADSRVATISRFQDIVNQILEDFIDPESEWSKDFAEAKKAQSDSNVEVSKARADQENALAEHTFWSTKKAEAFTDFSTCKSDFELQSVLGTATGTLQEFCNDEIVNYIDANGKLTTAMIGKLTADQKVNSAEAVYDAAKQIVDEMQDEIIDAGSRAAQIETMIQSQRALMQDIFTEYSQMYAGLGNITYASGWGDLVNDYRQINADTDLTFTKLPIDRAFVLISNDDRFVNPNEALAERSGVLNVNIPLLNLTSYGVTDMPMGIAPDGGRLQAGLPDTFSGAAEFALALGCSIQENGMDGFANFVNVTSDFEYTLKARGGYTATYDKKSFLEVIKKVSSKNRWFFKRKTVQETSITENNNIDFTIDFFADAEGNEFSPEEKKAVTSAVKERLLMEVLDAVGVRIGANTAEAQLPEPSVGSQAGQKLVASCRYGGGWMCYGGWILVGLDGLVGSREAENRFRQENHTRASETYRDTFFIKKWGSLSYGS